MPNIIGQFIITETYCQDCNFHVYHDGGDYEGEHGCELSLVLGLPEIILEGDSWDFNGSAVTSRKGCPGMGTYSIHKETDHMHL